MDKLEILWSSLLSLSWTKLWLRSPVSTVYSELLCINSVSILSIKAIICNFSIYVWKSPIRASGSMQIFKSYFYLCFDKNTKVLIRKELSISTSDSPSRQAEHDINHLHVTCFVWFLSERELMGLRSDLWHHLTNLILCGSVAADTKQNLLMLSERPVATRLHPHYRSESDNPAGAQSW